MQTFELGIIRSSLLPKLFSASLTADNWLLCQSRAASKITVSWVGQGSAQPPTTQEAEARGTKVSGYTEIPCLQK